MRYRNPWSIGLLVTVGLLVSSWLRPAAACCFAKCDFIHGGCKSSIFCHQDCQDDPSGCTIVTCTTAPSLSAGLKANGASSPAAAGQLCSLPPSTASAASTEAAAIPIKVVMLKART